MKATGFIAPRCEPWGRTTRYARDNSHRPEKPQVVTSGFSGSDDKRLPSSRAVRVRFVYMSIPAITEAREAQTDDLGVVELTEVSE